MLNVIQNTIGGNKVNSSTFEGFLNKFSGAVLGLSTMHLDSDYSGYCIEVRRSSDSTPLDIGFVNNVLDTAALLTFAGGGDAFVSKWYYQNGSGLVASQSFASKQPKIVDAGSIISENGVPALEFDGVDDQLDITPIDVGSVSFLSMIYKSVRSSADDYVLYGDSGRTRFRLFDSEIKIYINSAQYAYAATDGWDNQYLYQLQATSSLSLSVYRNDTQIGTAQTIPSGDNMIIGSIGYGLTIRATDGLMQEVILYDTDQSSNRADMAIDINSRFNIYN